jgi:hypothetical protein
VLVVGRSSGGMFQVPKYDRQATLFCGILGFLCDIDALPIGMQEIQSTPATPFFVAKNYSYISNNHCL